MLAGLAALLLAACGLTVPRAELEAFPQQPLTAYVVRRGWHTDIALAADTIPGPLAALGRDYPGAAYLEFGFGDRLYLQMSNKAIGSVLAVMWPERGLMLTTGLKQPPAQVYGAGNVVALALTPAQIKALADFVWQSFQSGTDGVIRPYANGPYSGSQYYASSRVYAGVRTCNTWTAQALHAAGLPVQSVGVLFAAQVWAQALSLRPDP